MFELGFLWRPIYRAVPEKNGLAWTYENNVGNKREIFEIFEKWLIIYDKIIF